MPMCGRDLERYVRIIELYVAASFNELLRDGSMPFSGRSVEGRGPILVLQINIKASCNELQTVSVSPSRKMLRDGVMSIAGRGMEGSVPIICLKINVTASRKKV